MIRAVIFDFDGVIAETMADNCKAWQHAMMLQDIKIDPIEYYLLEGMGRFQISEFFINKYNLNPMLKQVIAEAKEEYYNTNNSFRIYDEIEEILNFLSSKKIQIGLVSGASRGRISKCLSQKYLSFFEYIVTADDVTDSKPHPEPYLRAIDKLGIQACDALVIENAQLGIRSAKAAGCECFAIETTLDRDYLSESDEIFNNHSDLLTKFKTIFG